MSNGNGSFQLSSYVNFPSLVSVGLVALISATVLSYSKLAVQDQKIDDMREKIFELREIRERQWATINANQRDLAAVKKSIEAIERNLQK